jgi:SAM-dependent methyltransferase
LHTLAYWELASRLSTGGAQACCHTEVSTTMTTTSIEKAFYPRGKLAGVYPTLTSRQDEAYVEFIEDARNVLHHAQQYPIRDYSRKLMAEAGVSQSPDEESTRAATEFLMRDPAIRTFYRVKRTLQEAFWQGLTSSLNKRRDELLAALDEAEKLGPGTVQYDPDWQRNTPAYASREIHIQPGGYALEPLAGVFYDYGIKVFMGGAADFDRLHKGIAMAPVPPADGQVNRVLDLGVSMGATTIALKQRFPQAEVWGIDISAPMVRYAHLRAVQANTEIHLRQMAAEQLEFPDNHFDAVLAMLLFHELPVPVAKQVIAEVWRVLRPGGTFTVLDFAGVRERDVYSMFFVAMDAADNGEPYLPGYVRSNVEDLLVAQGFDLKPYDPKAALRTGRVAVKPAG